jgi:hypothetical protein
MHDAYELGRAVAVDPETAKIRVCYHDTDTSRADALSVKASENTYYPVRRTSNLLDW